MTKTGGSHLRRNVSGTSIYFVRSLGLDRAFPSPAFARKGISRLARSTCCQRPSALRTRRRASVRTTAIAVCPRNLASLSSLQTRALYSAASPFLAFRDEPFKLIASFCCLSMYGKLLPPCIDPLSLISKGGASLVDSLFPRRAQTRLKMNIKKTYLGGCCVVEVYETCFTL